ncbi:hypothetical protein JOB18_049503 [Solea senegalensis]|uniref:Uncharacterized protein n=1 Tax=Solea senegalensis TaxID=28829 RepID=A0AAV6S4N9_SOLSE|nr:hypothetical protein JOB18_049503 [Solea senegalensis]
MEWGGKETVLNERGRENGKRKKVWKGQHVNTGSRGGSNDGGLDRETRGFRKEPSTGSTGYCSHNIDLKGSTAKASLLQCRGTYRSEKQTPLAAAAVAAAEREVTSDVTRRGRGLQQASNTWRHLWTTEDTVNSTHAALLNPVQTKPDQEPDTRPRIKNQNKNQQSRPNQTSSITSARERSKFTAASVFLPLDGLIDSNQDEPSL